MSASLSGSARPRAVGVVIPARNEENSIVECLDSVIQALDAAPTVDSSWIVVVADCCNDQTAGLARRRLAGRGTTIECTVASAGTARRLGAAQVLTHFAERHPSQVWIANTDADSRVGIDWISHHLQLAARGFCGIAGIVRVTSIEGHDAAAVREFHAGYATYEDGTHPHVHGANLGVRADAYADAGGWSDLTVAEDHCLWSRVRARGWRTIASVGSVVLTSGRLHGRARGGFADTLRRTLEPRLA
jgi:cellulose synthase/poly-beta-1,6-N-acetylglucosamine synthase-like glycosyltransferase